MEDSQKKSKIKSKLDNWKSNLEYLNMQLHLGRNDAQDEFEKQKVKLKEWATAFHHKVNDAKDLSAEKATQIKSSLQHLRVQAALGKADTAEKLREQQKNLLHGIDNLKQVIVKEYHKAEDSAEVVTEETKDLLDSLHTKFDLFRLQAHLASKDAGEQWDIKKKELSNKLKQLDQQLDKNKELAEDKWDSFSHEMSEAWSHFKKAFKDE